MMPQLGLSFHGAKNLVNAITPKSLSMSSCVENSSSLLFLFDDDDVVVLAPAPERVTGLGLITS